MWILQRQANYCEKAWSNAQGAELIFYDGQCQKYRENMKNVETNVGDETVRITDVRNELCENMANVRISEKIN